MVRGRIVLNIFAVLLLFCSCSVSDSKTVTIGTFNIEWLGDGNNDKNPRTNEDYAGIANVIKETGADLLVLQEIENEIALKKILHYLPGFDYYISDIPGDQKIACIFRAAAGFRIEYIGDYYPLAFDSRLKPGMILHLIKGKKVIPLLALHLKATSAKLYSTKENSEARRLRYRQAMAANRWADSVIKKAKCKSLMIMGDFNDYIRPVADSANTLLPLAANKNLVFLTKDMKSCKYSKLMAIDHILVSNEMMKDIRKHSVRIYDINMALKDSQVKKISDHCPVLVDFSL